jgi:hypothetical protein
LSVPGGKGNTLTKEKTTAKFKAKPTSIALVPYSKLLTISTQEAPLFSLHTTSTVEYFYGMQNIKQYFLNVH